MNNFKKLLFTAISLFCLVPAFALSTVISDEAATGVDRYAIFIGSNKGGKGRDQLLYAGSDAKNFQKAMSEIGGLSDSNSYVLIDPSKEKIDETLTKISEKIGSSKGTAKRSEFIFYYSGHSDETALLLGDTPYEYSTLKAAITDVPSDIHVVILDSCYSGNFIRTKGGQKRKPFLIDDSSVVTGHAYLSSSSDNEYSQESDEIESSYFTNAMITGLRGAADTSGDNKVTLNELYSYAFNDTLSKTESSKAGPQHPNYNITLVGSGDLVLSDISTGESMLALSKDAKGKFIIRNAEGKLISEINKVEGQPIYMALSSGQYSAVIIDEYSTKQGTFILEKDKVYALDQNSLTSIKRKSNRVRGTITTDDEDDDGEILPIDDLNSENRSRRRFRKTDTDSVVDTTGWDNKSEPSAANNSNNSTDTDSSIDLTSNRIVPDPFDFPKINANDVDSFHLALIPGLNLVKLDGKHDTVINSIGIIGSFEHNVAGLQISNLMNITSGYMVGLQSAGLFNVSGEGFKGLQMAGLFNTASYVKGVQLSGIFNYAKDIRGLQMSLVNVTGHADGLQLGLVNIAEEHDGIALGLFNYIKNGAHDIGVSWDTNDMVDIFYQSGTNHLFFDMGLAGKRRAIFDNNKASDIEKCLTVFYYGIGTRVKAPIFTSFDFEILCKHVFGSREFLPFIIRTVPAFKFTVNAAPGKHFTIFGAVCFDLNIHGYNDEAFILIAPKINMNLSDKAALKPAFSFGFKIR